MNTDSIGTLIDLAMWFACVYCLYSWYLMKTTGKIHKNPLLIPPKIYIADCLDAKGYLAYMMPRILIFSLIGTVLGGVIFFGNMRGWPSNLWIPINAAFLANIIWFALAIRNSIKTYWGGA